MELRPKLKTWAEEIGLEPEEALALLIMLDDMSSSDPMLGNFKQDINTLQERIASVEIEKMLGDK